MQPLVYILYSPKLTRFYTGVMTLSPDERLENHLEKKYGKENFTRPQMILKGGISKCLLFDHGYLNSQSLTHPVGQKTVNFRPNPYLSHQKFSLQGHYLWPQNRTYPKSQNIFSIEHFSGQCAPCRQLEVCFEKLGWVYRLFFQMVWDLNILINLPFLRLFHLISDYRVKC